ncbi:MAG: hypothetical protein ACW9W4_02705 [Candidatus Nitrosopumilus sp. bin_7KS]
MKKSELKKLISDYKETKIELSKSKNKKLNDKLKLIEHKYYHEIGRTLKSDLEEMT